MGQPVQKASITQHVANLLCAMTDRGHMFTKCITKAIAVKSNKYTTPHISKGGWLLHLKMICSANLTILWRNTTSQSLYNLIGVIHAQVTCTRNRYHKLALMMGPKSCGLSGQLRLKVSGTSFLSTCHPFKDTCLLCLFSEDASRLSSSGIPSHDFYRNFCSACAVTVVIYGQLNRSFLLYFLQ